MFLGYYYENGAIKTAKDNRAIEEILKNTTILSYVDVLAPSQNELEEIGAWLNLHVLTLKNFTTQRRNSKVEEFENYLLTRMEDLDYNETQDEFEMFPVTIILTKSAVITIRDKTTKSFDNIQAKISESKSVFENASFLYYSILDAMVESYFPLVAAWGSQLDTIEESLLKKEETHIYEKIMHIRKNMLKLKKAFIYEHEAMYRVAHEDIKWINENQRIFIKDVYHHLDRLKMTLEDYKEWAVSLTDMQAADAADKLNDGMQALNIITFIFLPLGFMTGWYGMSFVNIPELQWKYGYFYFIGLTIAVSIALVAYFRRKKFF